MEKGEKKWKNVSKGRKRLYVEKYVECKEGTIQTTKEMVSECHSSASCGESTDDDGLCHKFRLDSHRDVTHAMLGFMQLCWLRR